MVSCIYFVSIFSVTVVDNMYGRTIALGPVYGRDQMVEKLYVSVDVMIIKLLQTHL
jgi:hypothetical protein